MLEVLVVTFGFDICSPSPGFSVFFSRAVVDNWKQNQNNRNVIDGFSNEHEVCMKN